MQGSRRRQEVALGVLGVDARLDGMAIDVEIVLIERQGFTGGDSQLPLDKVQVPEDRFGNGVLHL